MSIIYKLLHSGLVLYEILYKSWIIRYNVGSEIHYKVSSTDYTVNHAETEAAGTSHRHSLSKTLPLSFFVSPGVCYMFTQTKKQYHLLARTPLSFSNAFTALIAPHLLNRQHSHCRNSALAHHICLAARVRCRTVRCLRAFTITEFAGYM